MFSIFRRFANMFNFGNNSSEEDPEISVDMQPTINMPKWCDLSYNPDDKVLEDDDTPKQFSFHNINIFDLCFSIKYKISTDDEYCEIGDKYNYVDLKITLSRFTKKSSINEEYDETLHKPQLVKLPMKTRAKHGFYIIYNQSFPESNTNMKSATQHISLYSDYDHQIKTIQDIKVILGRLRNLIGLKADETNKRYAFRFHIQIEKYSVDDETPCEEEESIDVYTNVFIFSFSLGDSYVETEFVDEKYYHIPENYKESSGSDEEDELSETSDIDQNAEDQELENELTNCCEDKKSEDETKNCCEDKKSEGESTNCSEDKKSEDELTNCSEDKKSEDELTNCCEDDIINLIKGDLINISGKRKRSQGECEKKNEKEPVIQTEKETNQESESIKK